jgi:hypothetical protein
VFILAMPWYPPPGGRFGGDVSFWYATYCVVGLAMYVHLFPLLYCKEKADQNFD